MPPVSEVIHSHVRSIDHARRHHGTDYLRPVQTTYPARAAVHHQSPSNPKDEKEMDIHNNQVGLLFGRTGGSDQILSQRCMAALSGRRLKDPAASKTCSEPRPGTATTTRTRRTSSAQALLKANTARGTCWRSLRKRTRARSPEYELFPSQTCVTTRQSVPKQSDAGQDSENGQPWRHATLERQTVPLISRMRCSGSGCQFEAGPLNLCH